MMIYEGVFKKYNYLMLKADKEHEKITEMFKELNDGSNPLKFPVEKIIDDLNFIAACILSERVDNKELNLNTFRLSKGSTLRISGEGSKMILKERAYRRRHFYKVNPLTDNSLNLWEVMPDNWHDMIININEIIKKQKTQAFKRFVLDEDSKDKTNIPSWGYFDHHRKNKKETILFSFKNNCKIWHKQSYSSERITLSELSKVEGLVTGIHSSYDGNFKYHVRFKLKNCNNKLDKHSKLYLLSPSAKKLMHQSIKRLGEYKKKFKKETDEELLKIYKLIENNDYGKYLMLKNI